MQARGVVPALRGGWRLSLSGLGVGVLGVQAAKPTFQVEGVGFCVSSLRFRGQAMRLLAFPISEPSTPNPTF